MLFQIHQALIQYVFALARCNLVHVCYPIFKISTYTHSKPSILKYRATRLIKRKSVLHKHSD